MTGNNIVVCIPFLVSSGYIHLVSLLLQGSSFIFSATTKRVVGLKDQQNKGAHESSAQLACEAAASIRTVASLTREEDCLRLYRERLEEPLRNSIETTIWTTLLYAFSQSTSFYVIALVFWYGARLVSYLEISTMSFFVALIVRCLHTAAFERLTSSHRAQHLERYEQAIYSSFCLISHQLATPRPQLSS